MNDRAIIRSFESGFNKKIVAMTVLAVAVVLALIALVAGSFRGRDISGAASALTKANTPAQTAPARPPTEPVR
jgi:hypothetical protein